MTLILAAAGLLVTSTVGMIGCNVQPPDTQECDRTVSTTPSAGFVEITTTGDFDTSPADSSLARVFSPWGFQTGASTCENVPPPVGDFRILYEIGADGEVLNRFMLSEVDGEKTFVTIPAMPGMRFVVEDGCLTFGFDDSSDEPEDTEDDPSDPDSEIDSGPCGEEQVALGRDGKIMDSETTEEFICLALPDPESQTCMTCSKQSDAWQMEAEVSLTVTALGTLDNVSVSTWATLCGEEDVPVTINEGDEYTLSMSTTMVVTPSLSPEELGYTDAGPSGGGD